MKDCHICKGTGKRGSNVCGFCMGSGKEPSEDKHDANTEEMVKPKKDKTTQAMEALPRIDYALGQIDSRLQSGEKRFVRIENKVDVIKEKVITLENRDAMQNNRLKEINSTIKEVKVIKGFISSAIGRKIMKIIIIIFLALMMTIGGGNLIDFLQKNGFF